MASKLVDNEEPDLSLGISYLTPLFSIGTSGISVTKGMFFFRISDIRNRISKPNVYYWVI